MKKFLRFMSYVLVATLASCLTLMTAPKDTAASKLDQLSGLIQERFIGEVDVTAMEDAAAEAMVSALGDRWSHYIPASEYAKYEEQMANSYVGVGITITNREDGIGFNIVKLAPGSPAEEAGLQAGDILVGVDGGSLEGVDINQSGTLIAGEAGTAVTLTVLRDGEEQSFTMERRLIRTVVASGTMLEGNVGLVTIHNFNTNCAEETIAAVDSLIGQGAQALIFDVRNNPGGYVKELVKVLDHLLPEGDLFRSVYFDSTETLETSDANCVRLPMAVLVNGESYSAAEFFAAAIWEYGAGFVVGTQTCGKGYFQTTIQLKDGSAVGLSVGKYFTPKGISLAEAGGVTPDIPVEVDRETFNAIYAGTLDPMEDPQILAAYNALLEKGYLKSDAVGAGSSSWQDNH